MFLATTALEKYWDKSEKILFLGEWCLLYDRKKEWSRLNYEVLPNHWENREKLYRDYIYIENIYEKTLDYLVSFYNKTFNKNFSKRYYRILFGFWLNSFIGIIYDRFESLQHAIRYKNDLRTIFSDFSYGEFTALDQEEFRSLASSDEYNIFLFSKIIYSMECQIKINVDKTNLLINFHKKKVKKINFWKNLFKRLIVYYEKNIPNRFNSIIFSNTYINILDQLILQIKLCQLPHAGLVFNNKPYEKLNLFINKDLRNTIKLNFNSTLFEKIFSVILPEQIPKVYLEGFKEMNDYVSYDRRPCSKLIITATSPYGSDYFTYWCASNVDSQNTKLVCCQHGGHYGMGRFSMIDNHEIKISNSFFSWGWKNSLSNVKPIPSGKLIKNIKITPNIKGQVLSLLMDLPRYSQHLFASPIGASGMNRYMKDQFVFVEELNEEVKKILLIRPYLHNYGDDQIKKIHKKFPKIKISLNNTFYDQLKNSRIYVGTYNSTTFLETISINFPTIIFWQEGEWELNEYAKIFFSKLKKTGIFYSDPKLAANFLNNNMDNITEWWDDKNLQNELDEFRNAYCLVDSNWKNIWKEELLWIQSS